MNMEHEREQLLLKKKSLEKRIAEHQGRINLNLKDKGPKLPDFRERLAKLQELVKDLEKDLAEVDRQLGLLP